MAGETIITVVGNLTADPELRFTQGSVPVVNLTIASTARIADREAGGYKDGESLFLRAVAWRDTAEHIAATFTKGMRAIVQGRLRQRNYQDREGNQRTTFELEIHEIGPSLRFATAQVTRAAHGNGQQRPAASAPAQEQQWVTSEPPTGGEWNYGDDTPF
ncbi:single-stranded DNA-binding protein [Microbacterium sp. K35]|uniref:single-stranded DNA-binding protein n=1 Tax=Microbacterium sp. K35 TaxID=2305440 RepID=UPI00109B9541|nr:single-stranded DNA-binding protein [Microbacterium sp. K35]